MDPLTFDDYLHVWNRLKPEHRDEKRAVRVGRSRARLLRRIDAINRAEYRDLARKETARRRASKRKAIEFGAPETGAPNEGCIICDEPRTAVYRVCGHNAVCAACASKWHALHYSCPVCRTRGPYHEIAVKPAVCVECNAPAVGACANQTYYCRTHVSFYLCPCCYTSIGSIKYIY